MVAMRLKELRQAVQKRIRINQMITFSVLEAPSKPAKNQRWRLLYFTDYLCVFETPYGYTRAYGYNEVYQALNGKVLVND